MTQFIYNYTEWLNQCSERGWKILECQCVKEINCDYTNKICRVTNAIDINGNVQSIFKHFINMGTIYG
jgi:hypothetical protein